MLLWVENAILIQFVPVKIKLLLSRCLGYHHLHRDDGRYERDVQAVAGAGEQTTASPVYGDGDQHGMAAAASARPHVHRLRRHQPGSASRKAQPFGAATHGDGQEGGEHPDPELRRFVHSQAVAAVRRPLAVPQPKDYQKPLRFGVHGPLGHALVRLSRSHSARTG